MPLVPHMIILDQEQPIEDAMSTAAILMAEVAACAMSGTWCARSTYMGVTNDDGTFVVARIVYN